MIGLFFFIRASIKDRTERVTLTCSETEDNILNYLRNYFLKRAYQVTAIDGKENKVTLEGIVSPSVLLAILLSLMAGCGLFCFALVLSTLFTINNPLFFGLIILAPLAGFFYWRGAKKVETVIFKLDTLQSKQTMLKIQAHRDELIQLKSEFPFNYSVED
jgi:hypothetical protein